MHNIVRLAGEKINLTVLRTDEEAVSKYIEWLSDEATSINIETDKHVIDVSDMPGWLHDSSLMRFGIVEKATDNLIGYCHIDHRSDLFTAWLSINIGDKQSRGKGYGKDAIRTMCEYAFKTLGVFSVHADVLDTNIASQKTFESVGFKKSGKYRGHAFHKGYFHDWLHYDMILPEFDSTCSGREYRCSI